MIEARCKGPFRGHDPNCMCWQLLFRYEDGRVEIKCPRCKTVTTVNVGVRDIMFSMAT